MPEKELYPGWETVRKIGSGSFGAVYEIQRKLPNGKIEKAALKVISIPQNEGDIEELLSSGYDSASITLHFKNYLADIANEYSLMSEIKGHTNVVYCDDIRYVQHEDGLGWNIFIKMELLTPMLKRQDLVGSDASVIRLGQDICRALILCEGKNIIHRDIKPQNIFVSDNGDFKLGDFGIAKTVEKTTGGTKVGTYGYMAPEVYNNQPYGASADICSLGLVMYWLLNERRLPFLPLPPEIPTTAQNDEARLRRFQGEPIPTPKNGSEELKHVVLKACAYDPKARYHTAEEMLADLTAIQNGQPLPPAPDPIPDPEPVPDLDDKTIVPPKPVPPEPPVPLEPPVPPVTRKWILPALCIVAVLFLAGIGVIGWLNCWFGHAWQEATCIAPRTCTRCGETVGEVSAHTWSNGAETTAPSHTAPGVQTYTCTVCGETREEAIAAIPDHVFDREVPQQQYMKSEATCTAPAEYYYSCVCGEKGTNTFQYGEAMGHTYSEEWSSDDAYHWHAATCVHTGEVSDMAAHNWDSGVVIQEATTTAEGSMEYTCEICGAVKTESIPKVRGSMFCVPEDSDTLKAMGYYIITYQNAPFWGQKSIQRSQVTKIQFRGTLGTLGADAWDVSAAQDGSIFAWMDGTTLHVATDGVIVLNPNSAYLFYHFENLTSIDFGNCVDTAQVTYMNSMFSCCKSLQSLDLSGFRTDQVRDMSDMFYGCKSLQRLDLSGFDTAQGTDMRSMFSDCSSLTDLKCSDSKILKAYNNR